MTFISHAQNFEDVRLWRAFSDIREGRYLDIGTQDPVRDSVSHAFYERGWRGERGGVHDAAGGGHP